MLKVAVEKIAAFDASNMSVKGNLCYVKRVRLSATWTTHVNTFQAVTTILCCRILPNGPDILSMNKFHAANRRPSKRDIKLYRLLAVGRSKLYLLYVGNRIPAAYLSRP